MKGRGELLDELIEVIADRVATKAAERGSSAPMEYVDQRNAGVEKRIYVAAARAGEFPSKRVGRLYIARRVDVEAWLAPDPVPLVKAAASGVRKAAPPSEPPPASSSTAESSDDGRDNVRRRWGLQTKKVG